MIVNPTDYFLYLPLLPEVAAGVLDPRRITVPLPATLPRGAAWCSARSTRSTSTARTVGYTDPEGGVASCATTGWCSPPAASTSCCRSPGSTEHAHGFRGLPGGALPARPHHAPDRAGRRPPTTRSSGRRAARSSWSAPATPAPRWPRRGRLFTDALARAPAAAARAADALDPARHRAAGAARARRAARPAPPTPVLRERGVEVRMGQSVQEATYDGVELTNGGGRVPTRTLVWCVGVRPDPLVESPACRPRRAGCASAPSLTVPGHPEVFAAGDAAAVAGPDPPRRARPR